MTDDARAKAPMSFVQAIRAAMPGSPEGIGAFVRRRALAAVRRTVWRRRPMDDDEKPRNERGFRIFLQPTPQRYGDVKVTESSMAYAGAHCWIFQAGEGRESQGVHVDVPCARLLRDALTTFIEEAERGELTEPADG